MCLTIPKKVIEINDGLVTVEAPSGDRQKVKTIVELAVGDFCLTQQNIVIDKIDKKEALGLINEIQLIKRKEGV